MKHLKLFLLVFVACLIGNRVYAQQSDNVTLVVSADGPTKDEATKIALRSAIEQAYGAFVSANTTILNDELVKDEIVTVSSGNIKEYKEIASEQMPNGNIYVTLQATVSISNLISYAQSKGAETEFAGATFGMNLKLKELNKQNESKVIDNLSQMLKSLPSLFDYKLTLEEPRLSHTQNEVLISGEISILYTYLCKSTIDYIWKTLEKVSLTNNEIKEYEKLNIPIYKMNFPSGSGKLKKNVLIGLLVDNYYQNKKKRPCIFYLRNSYPYFDISKLIASKVKYIIYDNISNPTKLNFKRLESYISHDIYPYCVEGVRDVRKTSSSYSYVCYPCKLPKLGEEVGKIKINVLIPKEEVNKYSKFGIEAVN